MQNGYANVGGGMNPMQAPMYAQPMQPVQPISNNTFEPDDPIPDTPADDTDRKHRPRFVDYFMKRNSDNK